MKSVQKRQQSYRDAKVFKPEIIEMGAQMAYEMALDLRAMKDAIKAINGHIEKKPAHNRLLMLAINVLNERLKHELPGE